MRRNSYQPIVRKCSDKSDSCGNQEPDNWKYMSLPETNARSDADSETFDNLNDIQRNKRFSPKLSAPNSVPINGIMKVANWLAHRRRNSKELISRANAEDKHAKTKFRLTTDEKSTQKQLKCLIKNAHKRSSSSHSKQGSPCKDVPAKDCDKDRDNQKPERKFSPNSNLSSPRQRKSLLEHKESLARDLNNKHYGNDDNGAFKASQCSEGRFGRHYLVAKAKTLSIEKKSVVCERLCATWPQSNQPVCTIEDLVPEETISSLRNRDVEVNEDIKEWCIPFKDLHFRDVLKRGRHGDIFRGEWHGEVLIYTFRNYKTQEEIENFWKEISQFCMIRHENIMLFMGACVELPHLAVITSARKGPSIFEHIHIRQQSISLPNKINIARQIAQAMGYLHARGIVHKRLHSTNIILESRVKICLMDQGIANGEFESSDYGVIPKGHLTYLSPELMRCLQVEPPLVYSNSGFTPESDIYAFGTILYELLLLKYPYNRQSPHTVIWLIGNGVHDSIDHIKCSNILKSIIACCWNRIASKRPEFSFIVKKLQENVSLHKRHSCSEPERLNKTGLSLTSNKNICS
ncbi:kinase suppressor of Ras (KSR)-like protein [Dinothrombium tinctorium]|uniref:Kinase suppressor of Ras (KSR)-like protein n=1 Tax=Dinothrombium tinctorium TaxID=1965070 RepID=A0A3S3NXL3_9ACAR|nr:kinase suppressor of Ras (KSR)-like protein [Dinothrombium tinctorium]